VPIAATAEGHRGVNVIRPHVGSRTYTIVLHFDALADSDEGGHLFQSDRGHPNDLMAAR